MPGEVVENVARRAPRPGGYGHAEHDARDRRVHAGMVHGVPERGPRGRVAEPPLHVSAVHGHEHEGNDGRRQKPGNVQAVAVEQRDDQYAADVVEDRKRRKEDDEAVGNAALEQGEAPHRKSDVRRHGNGPSHAAWARVVESHEDGRRHDHPAHGGDGGQGRSRRRAELAAGELPFDLHSHDDEEERHQPVVDELEHREARPKAARTEGERPGPRAPVYRRQIGVGPGERQHCGEEEEDPTGRFELEERLDGPDDGAEQWREPLGTLRFRARHQRSDGRFLSRTP